MGFYPLKLSLADKTTGAPITTYTQLNLRVYPYASAEYSQLSQSGGTYEFGNVGDPILSGDYKLYDNATELTAFGIIRIGEPTAVLTAGDFTIAGEITFDGVVNMGNGNQIGDTEFSGDVDILTGNNLKVVDAPIDPTDVVRLTDLTGFAALSGGNEIADTQLFTGEVGFDQTPTCATADGTEGANYLINQGALQAAIDTLVVVPFQESSNNLRLMPSGIVETNKVYNAWTEIQTVAASYSTNNRRYTIEIKGTGESQNYITVNYAFQNYVSVKGDNQNIILKVADSTYSVTAGSVIVENVTIQGDGSTTDTPVFTNFIFKDVYFNMVSSSIGFVNCTFRGNCYVKNTGGSISFDGNCIGGYVATNGAITARMFGIDGLTSTDF